MIMIIISFLFRLQLTVRAISITLLTQERRCLQLIYSFIRHTNFLYLLNKPSKSPTTCGAEASSLYSTDIDPVDQTVTGVF